MANFNSETELHMLFDVPESMQAQKRVVISNVLPISYIFNDEIVTSSSFSRYSRRN